MDGIRSENRETVDDRRSVRAPLGKTLEGPAVAENLGAGGS